MSDTIHLPRALVNQLMHQAQIAPEGKMTGFIGARDGQPRSFQLTATGAPARAPAIKALQAQGETLFAILNSHPDSPAEPSGEELSDLEFPDIPQFIISLKTKGVLELRGYTRISAADWQEVELVLTEA